MYSIRTGLTSVTFRQKSPEEIIALAKKAGLTGIEWGGDVHVPAGDVSRAKEIAEKTRAAGLQVLSYGSYYRALEGEDFAPVLESAKALDVPVIRIWAGNKTFEESAPEEFSALAKRIREAAFQAADADIDLAFEYHRGTATQTKEGTLALLREVRAENVKTYWQPNPDISLEEQLAEIDAVLPFLSNIHVFTWTGANVRHPLADGADAWAKYLSHIREGGTRHDLILEFVQDDSEEAFLADAAFLIRTQGFANVLSN